MSNPRERQFQCTACKALVTVLMPEGTMINKPTFSAVILVHQEATICPGCGQGFSFILRGINLRPQDIAWAPVEIKKEDADIIIPPAGLAAAIADAAKKKGD